MTLSRSNGQSILLRIGRCTRYARVNLKVPAGVSIVQDNFPK